MMTDLSGIYDDEFFSQWGKAHGDYVSSAEIISSEIYRRFRPTRAADIGCGCGVYGYFLKKKGVEVFSLDAVSPSPEYSFHSDIHTQDLTTPFDNAWGDFDLTLCLEVAEHIPESLSDIFLKNLTQFSPLLVFSAAPPGQGGHHHVNEQPKRYWVRKLAALDFVYSRGKTGILSEAFRLSQPPYMWMAQHISVYERRPEHKTRPESLPFAVHPPTRGK